MASESPYLNKITFRDMRGSDRMHEARVEDFLRSATKVDAPTLAESSVTKLKTPITNPARRKKGMIDIFSVAEVLAEQGLNPAEEIAKALKGGKLDLETQVKLHATLLEYVAPKLKSVELNGTLNVQRTPEEIEARLQELAQMAGNSANG